MENNIFNKYWCENWTISKKKLDIGHLSKEINLK